MACRPANRALTGDPHIQGDDVVLFGMDFSVYVRIARLVLAEKGVGYRLEPFNPFEPDTSDPGPALHPFNKMPVMRHSGRTIIETQAIARYVDETFPGPSLQPPDAAGRAMQNQIIGICDNYLYRPLVWGLFVETVSKPLKGERTDDAVVEVAEQEVAKAFAALVPLLVARDDGPPKPGLADLFLAPMMDYGMRSDQGAQIALRFPVLLDWWRIMRSLPSMAATKGRLLPEDLPEDLIP